MGTGMRISCAHEAKSEVVIVSPVRSNGGGVLDISTGGIDSASRHQEHVAVST
jgi:putative methionine-R-sulfoxide reductase with GAF domain